MSTLFSYFKKSPGSNVKNKKDSRVTNQPISNEKKEVVGLQLGDVVWAKLEEFPFWPSMVCNDPSSEKFKKMSMVHVQFFGTPPTHDWVKISDTKAFEKLSQTEDPDLKVAYKQAKFATTLSITERMKEFYACEVSENEENNNEDRVSVKKKRLRNGSTPKCKRLKLVIDSDSDEDITEDRDSVYEPESVSSEEDYKSNDSNEEEKVSKKRKRKSSVDTPRQTVNDRLTKKHYLQSTTPLSKKKLNESVNKAQSSLAKFASSPSSSQPSTPTQSSTEFFSKEEYTHLKLAFLKDGQRRDKNKRLHNDSDYDPRTLHVPDSFLHSKEVSPGMKQWWQLKKDHYDTIIFFKVGKFYELYHMDAMVGVKELGLTFTKGKFAHCGFPEVAFGRYSEVLVQRGFKVARIEQTETPQAMAKRNAKVVQREVCAVISKGTRTFSFLEGNSDENNAAYLLAFAERPSNIENHGGSNFGICFVDTTTAKFQIGEFADDRQYSRFLTMISQSPPAQVLYERGKISAKIQHILKQELASAIKEALSPVTEFWDSSKTLKVLREESYFNGENKQEAVEWPPVIKAMLAEGDSIGLEASNDYKLALSSFGACIWYLKKCCIEQEVLSMRLFEEFVPSDTKLLTKLGQQHGNNRALPRYMVLDGVTLTNLDVTVNNNGTTEGTLLQLMDHCVTAFGKRCFKQWLCSPLFSVGAINNRLDAVEDLMNNASLMSEARAVMKTIPDLERTLRRVHTLGSLRRSKEHPDSRAIFYSETIFSKRKIGDLLAALDGFNKTNQVMELLGENIELFTSSLVKTLLPYDPIHNENGKFPKLLTSLTFFQNAFDHKKTKETGLIHPKKGVVPSYDEALQGIKTTEEKLDDYLKQQRKRLSCNNVVYWGKGKNRYQLEIPETALRSQTPLDYHLKSQRKGFKRYQSSTIERFLSELETFEDKRDNALSDTMREVFHKFDEKYLTWEKAVHCLSTLDCLMSLAYYSLNIDGLSCRPEVIAPYDDTGCQRQPFFEMINSRHPCLNQSNTGELIPNDIVLGKAEGDDSEVASCLLITGPNMGGKSTLMRQAGVLIIMAQLGCYVPAESCRFTSVDRVFTRLGARDRIIHGESTFFVELSETSTIFQHASKHSLVLLDELGRGTATYDGTAIASAVLHVLTRNIGCRILFSTHYHALVDSYKDDTRVKLSHMACMVEGDEVDGDPTKENITFLYKLSPGPCPKSYGFNAAKLAGIPIQVIQRAYEKAKDMEKSSTDAKRLRKIFLAKKEDLRGLLQCR